MIFIGGIIAAIGAVMAAWQQNKDAQTLAAKNDEIIRLNRVINDAIIGGDSYCYLSPADNVQNAFFINHVGDSTTLRCPLKIATRSRTRLTLNSIWLPLLTFP